MPTVPPAPEGLQARGAALWRDLHEDRDRGPDESVLIVEACRMVDRLDVLDAAMRGDPWMRLDEVPASGRWVVVVDRVVAEARAGALALKALIGELRLQADPNVLRGGQPPAPVADDAAPEVAEQEADPVDELRARRTTRLSDPAG